MMCVSLAGRCPCHPRSFGVVPPLCSAFVSEDGSGRLSLCLDPSGISKVHDVCVQCLNMGLWLGLAWRFFFEGKRHVVRRQMVWKAKHGFSVSHPSCGALPFCEVSKTSCPCKIPLFESQGIGAKSKNALICLCFAALGCFGTCWAIQRFDSSVIRPLVCSKPFSLYFLEIAESQLVKQSYSDSPGKIDRCNCSVQFLKNWGRAKNMTKPSLRYLDQYR